MNENHISGKWNELKGEIRSRWGKITDDELEATKGDSQSILGLLQQRYGDKSDDFKTKLDGLYDKFAFKKDQIVSDIKDKLRH